MVYQFINYRILLNQHLRDTLQFYLELRPNALQLIHFNAVTSNFGVTYAEHFIIQMGYLIKKLDYL